MKIIFDIETDGFLNKVKKIHCFSYRTLDNSTIRTIYNKRDIINLLSKCTTLVGHNIVRYDIPVLEKLLGISISSKLIDTLALSWYLNHKRNLHGLESYGEDFGRPKPVIDDWESLSREDYTHRCEEDVWINARLWFQLENKLLKIYGTRKKAKRMVRYLTFKMDCIREQEEVKWKVDIPRVEKNFEFFKDLNEKKTEELFKVLPKVPIKVKKERPKKPYKKDGSLSSIGEKWFELLEEEGLPKNWKEPVEVIAGWRDPNPGSTPQIKDWLFSLGWKPQTFKYNKSAKGGKSKTPQIRVDTDEGKELCPSVKKLIDKEPSIKILEDITVVQHRLKIFENFLKFEEDGYLEASVTGLTNTLRFIHKHPLVNLPGVGKMWGAEVRGSLIAEDDEILCGCDATSLESTTKRHYMYPYDPEYVAEMGKPTFDEHLDLAMQAGEVTQQDILDYKDGIAPHIKPIRSKFKPVNYGCVYGVQKQTLSLQSGMTQKEAQKMIDTYWERNWAVLEVVETLDIVEVDGEMWQLNPLNNLYYSLRHKKDRFSTLNQGTGVYCFDSWIREWRNDKLKLKGQFHDEVIVGIKPNEKEYCRQQFKEAVARVNKKLKLNVNLDVDMEFGKTYADIH